MSKPMKHTDESDLTRLAAGDLSRWRAAGLRRHLAACPTCAAAYADIARLWESARALTLYDAETADLAALRARVRPQLGMLVPPPPRRTVSLRVALPAMAAVLLLGGAAVTTQRLARPAVAFAQVEAATQSIRTASWNYRTFTFDRSGKATGTDRGTAYARLYPPAIAYQDADGRRLVNDRPGRLLTVSGISYGVIRTPRESADELRRDILESLLVPSDPVGRRDWRGAKSDRDGDGWEGATVNEGGRQLLRFRRHSVEQTKRGGRRRKQRSEYTIWAEPDTYRIVRSMVAARDVATGLPLWESVSNGFRYDSALPADALTAAPPVGKPVLLTDGDAKLPTPSERRTIDALLRRAEEAWNRRDWPAYRATQSPEEGYASGVLFARAAGQPYRGAAPAERTRQLRARFEEGRPWCRWRVDAVTSVYPAASVYVRRSAAERYPPTNRPADTYMVFFTGRASRAASAPFDTRIGGYFQVHRMGANDFRIGLTWFSPRRTPLSPAERSGTGPRPADRP